ncbi:MAG: hypothetical protein N2484_09030 [Clostridia bacterium]|nr:hypothetical protein [Clostridia bacterium]
MDNNKNLLKTEDKSRAELREMFPHDGEVEIESLKHIKKSHKQSGQSLKNTTTRS